MREEIIRNYKPFLWVFVQGMNAIAENEVADGNWVQYLEQFAGTFLDQEKVAALVEGHDFKVIFGAITKELEGYAPTAADLIYVMKKGMYSNSEYFLDDFFDTDDSVAGHSLVRFSLARLLEIMLAEKAEREAVDAEF